jgi:hypothetical protein
VRRTGPRCERGPAGGPGRGPWTGRPGRRPRRGSDLRVSSRKRGPGGRTEGRGTAGGGDEASWHGGGFARGAAGRSADSRLGDPGGTPSRAREDHARSVERPLSFPWARRGHVTPLQPAGGGAQEEEDRPARERSALPATPGRGGGSSRCRPTKDKAHDHFWWWAQLCAPGTGALLRVRVPP